MESRRKAWTCCETRVPKDEVVYICQIIAVYTVIIASIINLAIGSGDSNLWSALLSSCLGYILPSPSPHNERKAKPTEHTEVPGRSLL